MTDQNMLVLNGNEFITELAYISKFNFELSKTFPALGHNIPVGRKSLIQTLQEANQQNKDLLSHSLELIRGSYNLLNNAMADNPVYYRRGDVQKYGQTGKLLCSEI